MPFEDDAFDLTLAINSMQVWPDVDAGLRESWRVLTAGGRIALASTPRPGAGASGVTESCGPPALRRPAARSCQAASAERHHDAGGNVAA
jgi:ubiquinone/menaquinone biosynthesis C-methylase UbiE